jgi:hypothetical protein
MVVRRLVKRGGSAASRAERSSGAKVKPAAKANPGTKSRARTRAKPAPTAAAAPRCSPVAKPRPASEAKPRRAGDAASASDPLARVRALCLALPEASEKEAWGTPTFRVREKMFAMYVDDHHGDGRTAIWCKAPLGFQEMMVGTDGERFFVPPYVGVKGWIGVRLDLPRLDWDEVLAILEDGYRMTAPARLAALLDSSPSG